ncbi:iron-sulfur cluster assembly accessory protein [Desulfopila sp. IMCC35006]|uniref:IscA/HesB family protein n=1 Tax=Desulfopila sp. IMCC35006 TaxID=2569542 RepID=UPI0010ACF101|nr:IscA/HesB family protein [Desulfopila sp. IMCC35006]TKB27552.1 iron-sulfur cluster assembly accessory protein [Desulfopila sp. IMCC35006]
MLEITTQANEKLIEYLQANNISSSLRVAVMQGGCSGPSLGLALDEEKPTDELFKRQNLTFLVEKDLLQQCGSIKVDYAEAGNRSGFTITSTNPLPDTGGGCSSGSCGSGGCGC